MDKKKLLWILAICIGLLLIVRIILELNPHIVSPIAGPGTLNPAAFITLAAMLGLIFLYTFSSHLQYSQTVKWFSAINMDEVRDSDSCHHYEECRIDIPVPCGRAIHIARLALHLLPSVTLINSDSVAGIIRADTQDNFGMHSFVIISCRENGDTCTTVSICSFFPWPGKNNNGQNKKNIATVSTYLQEHAGQRVTDPKNILSHKNPATAAILSLVLPGLGQSYNGRSDEGMAIGLGTGVFLMLGVFPGIFVWLFGVYYSWSTARRMNGEEIPFYRTYVPGMIITGCFALLCLGAAWYVLQHFGVAGLVPMALDPVGTCKTIKCI